MNDNDVDDLARVLAEHPDWEWSDFHRLVVCSGPECGWWARASVTDSAATIFRRHQAEVLSGVVVSARDVKTLAGVYLAYDGGIRPWAVCATREAAVKALDDYMARCWVGAEVVEDWMLITVPEAEPVWVRYFTADGMVAESQEQRIEMRSLLREPATDAAPTRERR